MKASAEHAPARALVSFMFFDMLIRESLMVRCSEVLSPNSAAAPWRTKGSKSLRWSRSSVVVADSMRYGEVAAQSEFAILLASIVDPLKPFLPVMRSFFLGAAYWRMNIAVASRS